MKFVAALLLTALGFHAHASDIREHISIEAEPIQDPGLLSIQKLATQLVQPTKLSKDAGSCGDVITFQGPKDSHQSAENMQLWIHGIENELGTINLDEDIKLFPAPISYSDLRLKMTILADRSLLNYDVDSVEALTKAIYNEVHPHTKNYYFFFGDYLDSETGWMTAAVVVKISTGEAVFIAHSSQCY